MSNKTTFYLIDIFFPEEMVKLGRCLSCLENILVKNCTGENREETFDPAFIGRSNNIPLKIEHN